MKISLFTFYAVQNIGDRILTDTFRWLLQKEGHKVEIVDINGRYAYRYSGIIGKIEKWYANNVIHREKNIQNYFRHKIESSDFCLFAGGAVLDTRATDVSNKILQISQIACWLDKPVGYCGVGLHGDDFSNYKAENLRKSFSIPNVSFIAVRDGREQINQFLMPQDKAVDVVCDVAVWGSEAYAITKHLRGG